VRAGGVVVELDETSLAAVGPGDRDELSNRISALFSDGGFDYEVSFAPYRVGSAFVQPIHSLFEKRSERPECKEPRSERRDISNR
jgi:hypothetical protein